MKFDPAKFSTVVAVASAIATGDQEREQNFERLVEKCDKTIAKLEEANSKAKQKL